MELLEIVVRVWIGLGYVAGGLGFCWLIYIKRQGVPLPLMPYWVIVATWILAVTGDLLWRYWGHLEDVSVLVWLIHGGVWALWAHNAVDSYLIDRDYKRLQQQRKALDSLRRKDNS